MGNAFSTNKLYNNIKNTVKKLIYTYEQWISEDICDKLTVVYYDKLVRFSKDELNNASLAIGISPYANIDKTEKGEICIKIINHYKKRIDLLKKIISEVDKSYIKIEKAKKGNVCRKAKEYVDDFIKCQKVGGIWIDEEQYKTIIKNIKDCGKYDEWLNFIYGMENNWVKYNEKLMAIVDKIKKDIDNSIDDQMFEQLDDETNLIIKKMHYIVDIYYLLAINFSYQNIPNI